MNLDIHDSFSSVVRLSLLFLVLLFGQNFHLRQFSEEVVAVSISLL